MSNFFKKFKALKRIWYARLVKSLVDKVCDQNIKIKRVLGEKRDVEIRGSEEDKANDREERGLYDFYWIQFSSSYFQLLNTKNILCIKMFCTHILI